MPLITVHSDKYYKHRLITMTTNRNLFLLSACWKRRSANNWSSIEFFVLLSFIPSNHCSVCSMLTIRFYIERIWNYNNIANTFWKFPHDDNNKTWNNNNKTILSQCCLPFFKYIYFPERCVHVYCMLYVERSLFHKI